MNVYCSKIISLQGTVSLIFFVKLARCSGLGGRKYVKYGIIKLIFLSLCLNFNGSHFHFIFNAFHNLIFYGCLNVKRLVVCKKLLYKKCSHWGKRVYMKNIDWSFGGTWNYLPEYFNSIDGKMSYIDVGPKDAQPIVLVHGNPTWGYLYRNFIEPLKNAG